MNVMKKMIMVGERTTRGTACLGGLLSQHGRGVRREIQIGLIVDYRYGWRKEPTPKALLSTNSVFLDVRT